MDHNFPEALDAIIEDKAYARRSKFAKQNDKYICRQGSILVYNDDTNYIPTNEDIFAKDWQIFGKGLLGTGHVNKEKKDAKRNN